MDILKFLKNQSKYKDALIDIDKFNSVYIGNCASNLSKMLATLYFEEKNKNIIYVCEDIFQASKAYEIISDMVGADFVSFFPVEEFISSELVASSQTFKLARMLTLYNIIEGNNKIIVTNTEGLTRQMMSLNSLKKAILKVKTGDIIEIA